MQLVFTLVVLTVACVALAFFMIRFEEVKKQFISGADRVVSYEERTVRTVEGRHFEITIKFEASEPVAVADVMGAVEASLLPGVVQSALENGSASASAEYVINNVRVRVHANAVEV